jgi:hypothetical protein
MDVSEAWRERIKNNLHVHGKREVSRQVTGDLGAGALSPP